MFCSILSRIVRVTDEVVEYRAWIKNFPVRVDDNAALLLTNLPRTYASVATSPPSNQNK